MDSHALKEDGQQVLEYIGKYWDEIRDRPPLHSVQPGYLTKSGVLPDFPPDEPETIQSVLQDMDKHIMPGMTQWHHPNFFAYFPTACSYPGILADMLCGALGCIGFTWNSSPACTELEMVVMNWLAKVLALPECFHYTRGGKGGGLIQGTASEATLVALLAARTLKLKRLDPDSEFLGLIDKLVCYCSEQAHCSVEKAALIAHVKVHQLKVDNNFSLRGEALRKAIARDKKNGLIPIFVCATLGTTSSCSFDDVKELGKICEEEGLWLHVDAAYAGAAAICPEFRYLFSGIELADSFNFNPHKWMMVNFDCSAMWMKDCYDVASAFSNDPIYLQHNHTDEVIDFRHMQIPLGRRFRSLKIWLTFRLLGVKALQENIRKQVRLAKLFESYINGDRQYELVGKTTLGLVCFRVKGVNSLNESLCKHINEADRRIHLVPSKIGSVYFLRLAICSTETEESDVELAWRVIQECKEQLLEHKTNGLKING